MILFHPATIGTILWVIGTVALVVAFAGRTFSAAFGISTSLVRGVRDWARQPDAGADRAISPRAVELPPLPPLSPPESPASPAAVRRIQAGAAARWRVPPAEVEELPRRPLH
jgi:hypothetical protein